VTDVIRQHVREGDVVHRTDGDGFVVLLCATTEEEGRAVAERVRADVESAAFAQPPRSHERITVSAGLCVRDGGDPDAALRDAEQALDRARERGNSVVIDLGPSGPGLLLS
jgi:diguanylate cyclase (GGDEF)-like protein